MPKRKRRAKKAGAKETDGKGQRHETEPAATVDSAIGDARGPTVSVARRQTASEIIKAESRQVFTARGIAILILFVAFALALESAIFHGHLHLQDREMSFVAKFFKPGTSFGYRAPQVEHTVVINVDSLDGSIPKCKKRRYLSRVLRAILERRPQPSAVAVVYTLESGVECPDGETEELLRAIAPHCSAIPVVFGHDLGRNYEVAPHEGLEKDKCTTGFTNPNSDRRHIPLEIRGEPEAGDSLAWAVAKGTKPDLPSYGPIRTSLADGSSLFGSFFSAAEFGNRLISDGDLFGVGPRTALDGKVVVIGGFGDDTHVDTENGKLPSYLAHASYIEALLDRRVFRALPDWVHLLVATVFWTWITAASFVLLRLGWKGLALSLFVFVTSLLTLILLTFVSLQAFGYYNDCAMVSVAAFILWLFSLLKHLVQSAISRH